MSPVRAFLALDVDPETRTLLGRAASAIRSADASWRDEKWVAEENLHITLKFLGDVGEAVLPGLSAELDDLSKGFAPFDLERKGIRAVGGPRRCRMLWGTFEDSTGACSELAAAIDARCAAYGIPPEHREFSPHVTICRARRPKPVLAAAAEAADQMFGGAQTKMSVGAFTLYSSTLSRTGPTYHVLNRWTLGQP